jgi:hypothetical protein
MTPTTSTSQRDITFVVSFCTVGRGNVVGLGIAVDDASAPRPATGMRLIIRRGYHAA